MTITDRRGFIKSAATVAVTAIPTAMLADETPEPTGQENQTVEDQINHHVEALLALIREEFPDEATGLGVVIRSEWDADTKRMVRSSVGAQADQEIWEPRDANRDGGYWIQNSLGHWAPGVGRY